LVYSIFYALGSNNKKVKGINNIIEYKKVLFKNIKITITGNSNKIIIDKGTRLTNCKIKIMGNNHQLIICDNCILKNTEFWIEDSDCKIQVGSHTTIEGAQIASVEKNSSIIIGEDCMLSQGINITTTDSHSIIDANTQKRINRAKNIVIGNHVWIGAYCKILKGVTINDNTVIGIGSTVTKSITNNCVAVGVPAKVTKHNINWLRNRI